MQAGRVRLSDGAWRRERPVELQGRFRARTLQVLACFGAAGFAFGIGALEPIVKPSSLVVCAVFIFIGSFVTPSVWGMWQDLRAVLRRLGQHDL